MIVHNNLAAMQVVNVLNQNTKDKEKNIRALSSGEKISSAGDGASEYGISEKMRVQLRALGQNDRNVQNGSKLLKTAEGGIQEQIELMKKIKGLVIQASNSYLTDEDLAIIQKDIDACYDEIEDIAVKTNFNEIGLLNGSIADKVVIDWAKLSEPKEIANSGLDLIPGGTQQFEPVQPYVFDFTGKTAADLRGQVFTVEDAEGNIRNFIFADLADYNANIPSGYTGINISDGINVIPGYPSNTIASNFAQAIAGSATDSSTSRYKCPYEGSGNKVAIYCDKNNSPLEISGLEKFETCKLDGTSDLDKTLSGGSAGTSATFEFDFSSYSSTSAIAGLEGQGFSISVKDDDGKLDSKSFIFADPAKGKKYPPGYTIIDLSKANSSVSLTNLVGNAISKVTTCTTNMDAAHGKITLTTKGTGSKMNSTAYASVAGISEPEVADDPGGVVLRPAAPATGIGGGWFSGGSDKYDGMDTDDPNKHDATTASLSKSYSKPSVGSGLTVGSTYIRFISGSGTTKYNAATKSYEIGVDSFVNGYSHKFGNFTLAVNGGKITFTANSPGNWGNSIYVSDGITLDATLPTVGHAAITPFGGTTTPKAFTGGKDSGDKAKTEVDISTYSTKQALIDNLAGTGFYFNDTSNLTSDSKTGAYTYFEFINSAADPTDPDKDAERIGRYPNSLKIDLNAVNETKNFQSELVRLLEEKDGKRGRFTLSADGTKLIISCETAGAKGNDSTVKTIGTVADEFNKNSDYAHYTVDFEKWIADHASDINKGGGLVKYLTGKGFRTDCSTCSNQWFNFEFVTDDEVLRPNTEGDGTINSDIHNYSINISAVTDAKSLVQAIYDQGISKLNETNHFMKMRLEKDADGNPTGELTMYDERMTYDKTTGAGRADNAVIRDGIKSDWARADRALEVEELYIHHMQRANMNIHLKIPKTTLDNIFNYNKEYHSIKEYNVFTKESRDRMLGKPPKEDGEVDKALNYLSSAITLVGAQNARLEQADANIITQHENTTAAESTIRDTNMAKSMVAFTKSSILTQTAQAMLAQANMKPQSILSLLQ